jgi:hypothetical protein
MISQLSIFVENKPGALEQVLRLFKDSHIDLVTTTLADTQDFGLFRVICADRSAPASCSKTTASP